MENDVIPEVAPGTAAGEKRPLVDMTDPAVARTAEARLADPYALSGAPEDERSTGEVRMTDPYTYTGAPETAPIKLSEAAEAKIKEDLAAYNKTLTDNNFTFGFEPKEGPWNAINRLRTAATEKQKAGTELTAQEKAVLAIPEADLVKEARRIRDRDFATFKENGDPRTWYKTSDKPEMYTAAEMAKMMKEKEAALRTAAEKAQKEQQEKEAAEALARKQEEEKQRLALEQQRLQEEERQKQLAAAIEKNVPAQPIVQAALTEAGLEGDPAAIRTNMKAFVAQEVQAGTLKPEDLSRPVPRVGAAYIATGALTPAELTTALTEQARLKQEAGPEGQAPKLGEILEKQFKDQADRLAKIKKASTFYDSLKRLAEAAAAPAPAPEAK